ncbi:hypothetical protein B9Z55_018537 [Caenorhabditis nigoni]|uniref:G-protein coupled receptors family 1 profile domain-containing protein n=1 Tax=Caenorhabditis nigoni TaxID=1611254 RepID=A0A2G5TEU8_9PELO|nr:hypothetical protein B9Z55_018537 [Caenorhabditis nigoni]
MNRSWEEIFMENCGPARIQLLSIISSLALVPLASLFFGSICAFYNSRKNFHPLFSFCFLTLLTLYYSSTTILAIRNIIFSIYGDNFQQPERNADLIIKNCERLYMAINFYIPPLIAISILERLIATTFSRYYEHARPWYLLGIGLACASILVYIEFSNRHELLAAVSTKNIQTLFAITCSVSLCLLLLANRAKSKHGRAKSALSERYQVNENVRALRVQIPVVVIDTAIQIMFLCSDMFWKAGQVLNLNNCYDDDRYLNKFTAFRLIGFTLQYFIPCIVMFHFTQFCCNSIRRRPNRRIKSVSPHPETTPITVLSIRNVLGMPLTGEHIGASGQEAHFKNLHDQWNA